MSATLTRTRRPALFMVAAFVAFVAAVSPLAAAGRAVVVVHPAKNAKLGKTILVNLHGHTLYQLSAEGGKKFICTDSKCLSVWHPLVVKSGVKPTGASRLATVKRPDGRIQVTFRGRPLYTFSGDMARGDANGEGFKDVGTWHAASLSASSSKAPAPSPSPYPYP